MSIFKTQHTATDKTDNEAKQVKASKQQNETSKRNTNKRKTTNNRGHTQQTKGKEHAKVS